MKLSFVVISISLVFIFSLCGSQGDGLKTWILVWFSNEDLGGTAGTDLDIFAARSTDNGASWSTVQTLNSNANTDTGHDAFTSL